MVTTQTHVPPTRFLPAVTIVLGAWALLAVGLGWRSLWTDEYLSLTMARGGLLDAAAAAMSDLHPPLYFMALNLWLGPAGDSEFGLRALSALAGVVAVALMRPMTAGMVGRRLVLVGMAILAVAPAAIFLGRMTRYYGPLMTLGMLSTTLLLRALRSTGTSPARWMAYALSGIALVYTFYFGGALLLAHGAWLVARRAHRRAVIAWLLSVGSAGAAFAPWAILALPGKVGDVFGTPPDLSRGPVGMIASLAASANTFAVGETIFPWNPLAMAGLLAAAILAGRALLAHSNARGRALLAMAGFPILLLALATSAGATPLPFLNVPVRGVFALPYALLALVTGAAQISNRRARAVVVGALAMAWAAGITNNLADQQLLNPIYLTPSRQAAERIQAQIGPGDLIVSEFDTVFGHYAARVGPLPYRELQPFEETTALIAAQRPARVWVVNLGRDRIRSDDMTRLRSVLDAAYLAAEPVCLAPIDPLYVQYKSVVARRPAYDCRLSIERYDRVP